jgi:hypothetical protein
MGVHFQAKRLDWSVVNHDSICAQDCVRYSSCTYKVTVSKFDNDKNGEVYTMICTK